MNDTSAISTSTPSTSGVPGALDSPSSRPRRRRIRVIALAGAVAVLAGGTGALAATIGHRGDSGSASPGPWVYIPYAGQSGASFAGTGGRPVQGAAPLEGVPSGASASVAWPYPGVCSGMAPAQVGGQTVTATGTATVAGGAIKPDYVLSAWVSSQSSGGTAQAVVAVQRRLSAITDALARAGIDRASIHASAISAYAGTTKGVPAPATPDTPKQAETTVTASAGLTAQLPDAPIMDKAVTAAASAGADSVTASTQTTMPTAPGSDALDAAMSLATDQAHQLATAAAKAAGVTLGPVRSVSTEEPIACGYGVDGPQLVVGVTVAYAIA